MSDLFQDGAAYYDQMVDWQRRLEREAPFYKRLVEQHHVRSVLDCACGTGHHAAMFAGWGLTVTASDLSEEMVERARKLHGEHSRLRWLARSFHDLSGIGEPFDAVMCVGNSLALAADGTQDCREALASMAAVVRPGGLLMVHVLNIWRVAPGELVVQKLMALTPDSGEALLLKLFHRVGSQGYVDTVVASRPDAGAAWCGEHKTARPVGLRGAWLRRTLTELGFGRIDLWGDYQFTRYRANRSVDLIVTAVKAGPS